MKKILIKYHNENIEKIAKIKKGDWIDLRASKTVALRKDDYKLIPLGVSIKLPKGYEANIVPRSSTYKNWGVIQTNSFGVVDNSYCGDNDVWMMPVYATRDTVIKEGDRVCQFRINKTMPKIKIKTVKTLSDNGRGGFGSTGIN